jgi:hypothetical protein
MVRTQGSQSSPWAGTLIAASQLGEIMPLDWLDQLSLDSAHSTLRAKNQKP